MKILTDTIDSITGLDTATMEKAQERLDNLLKPPGSLGKLEGIAKKISGITGEIQNSFSRKTIIAMCADNGVVEDKVSSFPKDISFLVADCMAKGLAGVSVLSRHAGADLRIVDLGLDTDAQPDGIIQRKIRKGTSNISKGPAMTRDEAVKAIETGIEIACEAIKEGSDILGTGEVGIGNTTTSSAILYAYTGDSLDSLVGRGAGLDDEGLENKKEIIKKAIEVNTPDPDDPIDVLAKVGGFDIAGLVGVYLAAASKKIPVVVDGFISGTAAVVAAKIKPEVTGYMLASHSSAEPGAAAIRDILQLDPMLNMDMRLGEGTGCALAFNVIDAATKVMKEMGTFADIGM
jgi:nicotinate-nucleotide--dimethylbenzimidazole phosphoribosyltransferase